METGDTAATAAAAAAAAAAVSLSDGSRLEDLPETHLSDLPVSESVDARRALLAHAETHKSGSAEYIKSSIYGGLDGLISIFVSVVATAGTGASLAVVLATSMAKVAAGSISMGVGDFLGTGADVDFIVSERRREEWYAA